MITGIKRTLKAHMGEGVAPVVRLPESESTVQITIDGHELHIPSGATVMEAALSNGIFIPHFCYHPGLGPEGNCRMCLVEIEGRPKLEPSCIIPVCRDMVVNTCSADVVEARRGVMEFLLLNHPLDCPWCDKAGECMLQDHSYNYGSGETRHRMHKRTSPVKDFGPKLKMYSNRCIQCTRCVRFLAEVEGGEEFSLFGRSADVDVGTYIRHNLTNNYQGCLADVCPVGALVTKPFLYSARVFYLESQPSVCPICSTGCSIFVDRYQNRIVRIRPRPNLEVNEWWMCDTGRFETGWIEEGRVDTPMLGSEIGLRQCGWDTALDAASKALKSAVGGQLGSIVWAGASCEEIHLFTKLLRALGGIISPWYGPDGRIDPAAKEDFLRRKDPNPNTRGLEAIASDLMDLEHLLGRIDSGEVASLIVLGTVMDEAVAARLSNLDQLIVISSHHCPVGDASDVLLPGTVWVEKAGTFLNGEGHLQRFSQVLDIKTAARTDVSILSALIDRCGLGPQNEDPAAVYEEITRQPGPFKGLAWGQIPPGGRRLDLKLPASEPGTAGREGAE